MSAEESRQKNPSLSAPATHANERSRRRSSFLAVTAIVAGLWAAWFTCNRYRNYPLRLLPEVDLSHAHVAVTRGIETARKAVIAAPRSGLAWGELGLYLRAHTFDAEAESCLAQAMRYAPHEALWPYIRGAILSVRDPAEAELCFRLTARLRPELGLPRIRLGELFLEQRRLDDAETEFQAAIQIEPENARAWLGLGLVAMTRGDTATARRLAEQSFALDPLPRQTAALLLRVFHRQGDMAAAARQQAVVDQLSRADVAWPDPFEEKVTQKRRDLARLADAAHELEEKGSLPEAVAVLERLYADEPDSPQWPVAMGRLLIQRRNFKGAVQVLDLALARHPHSAELHFQRGVVDFLIEEWEPAAARFQQAIELKPDFSDAYYNLGQTLIRLDDRARAISAFRDAVRFRPTFAAAYTNLGKLLIECGEREAGRAALETAARLDPEDRQTIEYLGRLR